MSLCGDLDGRANVVSNIVRVGTRNFCRVLISWLLWWSPAEQDRQSLAPGSYDGHKETHSLHLVIQLVIFIYQIYQIFYSATIISARGVNTFACKHLFYAAHCSHLIKELFRLYKLICHLPVTGKYYPLCVGDSQSSPAALISIQSADRFLTREQRMIANQYKRTNKILFIYAIFFIILNTLRWNVNVRFYFIDISKNS